jgi:hypothetical protein
MAFGAFCHRSALFRAVIGIRSATSVKNVAAVYFDRRMAFSTIINRSCSGGTNSIHELIACAVQLIAATNLLGEMAFGAKCNRPGIRRAVIGIRSATSVKNITAIHFDRKMAFSTILN